jgi:exonuclease VII small subunit
MANELVSIKDQLSLLDEQVDDIMKDNDNLTPEALQQLADSVKGVIDVPADELAMMNAKIVSTPIENNAQVLDEAIGSVADLKELLRNCHGILNQVYTQIASLDISEPRMIEAAAAFVAAMKDTIQSFIDLYRDEQNFLHSVILKKMDFEQKKQLIKYRHDLSLEANTMEVSSTTVTYSQEELMKMINQGSET